MEELILNILWFLADLIAEGIFQYLFAAFADLSLRTLKIIVGDTETYNSILSAFGYFVLGLAAGGLSVLIFPHPLTHRSRIPGISLVAGPLITGVLMWATGALLRSQDKKSTRMESFGYASTFAFAMALVRFIFARPA